MKEERDSVRFKVTFNSFTKFVGIIYDSPNKNSLSEMFHYFSQTTVTTVSKYITSDVIEVTPMSGKPWTFKDLVTRRKLHKYLQRATNIIHEHMFSPSVPGVSSNT